MKISSARFRIVVAAIVFMSVAGFSAVKLKLDRDQARLETIRDHYNLARSLYVQGKYELCLSELALMHEQGPSYENSEELNSFCEQGRELVFRQRDLEYKERQRKMIDDQIVSYAMSCKTRLPKNAGTRQTSKCLGPAIELQPDHPLVVEMMHRAYLREKGSANRKGRAVASKKAESK